MRRLALLAMPLLVLGLAPLSADPAAHPEGHNLTIPTITTVESSDDMMMSKDMMMEVDHTHVMGVADEARDEDAEDEDDVVHSHSMSHTHDMENEDPADDVTHYHGEYDHSHDDEGMVNAPDHTHEFHSHDDSMHYHLGGSFGEHEHEMVHAGPAVTLEGSSTLTFGIDLDTNATGFKSENKVDLKVVVVPKATKSHSGETGTDDLYATVELKDFQWEITSADGQGKTTAPSITTSLFMGPFSLKTYALPDLAIDYVDPTDGDDDNGDDKEDEFPGADFDDVESNYEGAGLEVSYKIDPIMLSLGVVSEDDWIQDGPADKDKLDCHTHDPATGEVTACKEDAKDNQNDENAYAFIGTVNLDIGDDAKLEAKVSYAHEYSSGGIVTPASTNFDEIGIGAKADFDLGDITTYVAFDTAVPSDGATIPWDVGGGVKWNLSEDEKAHVKADMMMYSPAGDESKLYVALTLAEADGDEGALEALGANLSVGLDDAAGDSNWNAKIGASYKVNDIKPYFDVSFGSADDATTGFKAGLELTMIEHLTTTIEYESEAIGGADPGQVTTALKIEY